MVFLRLAGPLLRIFFGLCPWEIPWSSPASPWKTLSNPPLLLGLTQSILHLTCNFAGYKIYKFKKKIIIIWTTWIKLTAHNWEHSAHSG